MDKPWFDPETGHILFDEYVAERPSFRAVTADRIVTEEEVARQAEEVIRLLRELDSKLNPELRQLSTDVFCEIAVLNALHLKLQAPAVTRS
jgi:hypothetical protein